MRAIGWLGGYTLVSMVVAFVTVRIFEAVTSPFFKAVSRIQQAQSSSSERGQR